MIQIAKAKPAIFFAYGDAVQPEITHRRPQFIAREPVVGVDFRGQRRNLVARKTVRAVADHFGVFAKREIELGEGAHMLPLPAIFRRRKMEG